MKLTKLETKVGQEDKAAAAVAAYAVTKPACRCKSHYLCTGIVSALPRHMEFVAEHLCCCCGVLVGVQ